MSDFLDPGIDNYCFIDTETLSGADLKATGVYPYSADADFRVMIVTYAIGEGPVQIWEQEVAHLGGTLDWNDAPADLWAFSERVENGEAWFVAWNAGFDRLALSRGMVGGGWIRPEHFLDGMVQAVRSHLPPDLASAGRFVNAEVQKRPDGKRLIQQFCVPPFASPADCNVEWQAFRLYALDDIPPVRAAWQATLPLTRMEWEQYWASERVNDRGMPVDRDFAIAASAMAEENALRANANILRLTGGAIQTVHQHEALCAWVLDRIDHLSDAKAILLREVIEEQEDDGDGVVRLEKHSLERSRVEDLIAYLERLNDEEGLSDDEWQVLQVLNVRCYGASATPRKFTKLLPMLSDGDRLRGQYVFSGAAATGRYSSRGLQIHNLTRATVGDQAAELAVIDDIVEGVTYEDLALRGPVGRTLSRLIRPVFVAPPGQKMIWADYSAIEARVLPWLGQAFGAGTVLDIFRNNDADKSLPDIYKLQAGAILGKDPSEVTKAERQSHGKVPVLALGFGGGKGALFAMARAYGASFTDAEAADIVRRWRDTNPWARRYWDDTWEAALWCMANPDVPRAVGDYLTYVYLKDYMRGTLVCMLPDGRPLLYPAIKWEKRERKDKLTGKVEVKDQLTYRRGYGRAAVWYGTLCLGGDTEVATDRGWVRITDVRLSDKLWDGVAYVTHDGLIYQGEKRTILVDGVNMTPDHQVLSAGGWVDGGQSQGLERAEVRLPDGFASGAKSVGWSGAEAIMDSPSLVGSAMRLRDHFNPCVRRTATRPHFEMCNLQRGCSVNGAGYARYVETPRVCSLAVNAGSLPLAVASGVAKLRRARDHGMRCLVGRFLGLLVRYGRVIRSGFDFGASGQRRAVLGGELLLGNAREATCKSSYNATSKYGASASADLHFQVNTPLSVEPHAVYDLTNAGPRSRFVVRGDAGPFVVHNCENAVQAVAGSILRHAIWRMERDRPGLVVGHTHDECIGLVDIPDVADGLDAMRHAMLDLPPWAAGLPMSCEATESFYYSKTID